MILYIILGTLCLVSGTGHGRQLKSSSSFRNATVDFTIGLLKELTKTPGNVIFSPTSIGVLLSVLQQAANGNTKEELNRILSALPDDIERGYQSFFQPLAQGRNDDAIVIHTMATKMYVNARLSIDEQFQRRLADSFNMDIGLLQSDPSQSAADINQWVYNATNHHITNIVEPQSLSADTALVMLSAMFFNGKWEKTLKEAKKEKFRVTRTSHVLVPFLTAQQTLTAGRENNYKWIELPYKGGTYSMYLIRPTAVYKHDLGGMLDRINGHTLRNILKAKTKRNVALRLPKFKIQQRPAIKAALEQMGLKQIFTSEADLSGMGKDLLVSDIAHQAYIDVNEEGTEAAAATAVLIHTLSANWDPNDMDFRLDEPFLAFVVDKLKGVPILAARIADPSQ